MTTWIIFFALALLSIVVFVFALRSQQDAEALEDRLAGTIDEEAAAHPHQAGGILRGHRAAAGMDSAGRSLWAEARRE